MSLCSGYHPAELFVENGLQRFESRCDCRLVHAHKYIVALRLTIWYLYSLTIPNVEIEGTIRDAATGVPIAGAKIVVEQGAGRLVHDASSTGTYAVAGIVRGEVQVTVSAPGYKTTTRTFPAVKGRNRLDVGLTREP